MSNSQSSTILPVKIAIIGGGLIGPRHALSVKSLHPSAKVQLVALVDPAQHGASLAASLGTDHFTSLSDLLRSPGKRPDAVVICTPNHTHVTLALECIEAGIPILVEKPIATTIESGKSLVARAKEMDVKVLVGHHRRFNPYLVATKQVLDAGSLGRVIAVQGTWCLQKPSSYFDDAGKWRRNRENGGVVWINLVHDVDLLQHLLGPIIAVSAFEAPGTRGFAAEEGAAIILKFESGTVGTFVLSDAVPSPWAFEAGTGENPTISKTEAEEKGAGGFWRLMGMKGSLSVPDMTMWFYDGHDEENGWGKRLAKQNIQANKAIVPLDEQMKHFVNVVRNEEVPRCTGVEALSALVVCEAVKRAMLTGKQMKIDDFEIEEGP